MSGAPDAGDAPQVIVLAGPNGAGKSTLAPHLLRDTLGLTSYVNADTIAQGLAAFDPQSVAVEAGRVMLRRLRELADARRSFAFETTLASRSYARWLDELRRAGYEVYLFFLWLDSPDVAVERVRERVRLGGHDIPEAVIRRRYEKGRQNFFRLYQPLADAWYVYDNSRAGAPVPVAAGRRGGAPVVFDADAWQGFGAGEL